MVVVTAGVSVGERLEDRLIAGVRGPRRIGEGIHVVEAHGNRAFPGVEAAGRQRLAVGPRADRLFDPHELVVAAAIDVLPHLEEAVNGVTGVGGIGNVPADLERTVRQVGGEARVRHAARLACRVRSVRLRQSRVLTGRRSDRVVLPPVAPDALPRELEVGTGRAVGVDDALGEQIADLLAAPGLVGSEDIVEGVILTHDDDHVPDRRRGGALLRIRPRRATQRARGQDGRARDQDAPEESRRLHDWDSVGLGSDSAPTTAAAVPLQRAAAVCPRCVTRSGLFCGNLMNIR